MRAVRYYIPSGTLVRVRPGASQPSMFRVPVDRDDAEGV
jgi:hypothetical protein